MAFGGITCGVIISRLDIYRVENGPTLDGRGLTLQWLTYVLGELPDQ